MFSGQEPIAKISEDVNSSALPVFQSTHDTESRQENIKDKKEKCRAAQGEVIHEQGRGDVFLLSFSLN